MTHHLAEDTESFLAVFEASVFTFMVTSPSFPPQKQAFYWILCLSSRPFPYSFTKCVTYTMHCFGLVFDLLQIIYILLWLAFPFHFETALRCHSHTTYTIHLFKVYIFRRPSFDPWFEKIPGEGNGYPLQYSCLENSMDRGAWWATVHGITKNWARLNNWHFHCLKK